MEAEQVMSVEQAANGPDEYTSSCADVRDVSRSAVPLACPRCFDETGGYFSDGVVTVGSCWYTARVGRRTVHGRGIGEEVPAAA